MQAHVSAPIFLRGRSVAIVCPLTRAACRMQPRQGRRMGAEKLGGRKMSVGEATSARPKMFLVFAGLRKEQRSFFDHESLQVPPWTEPSQDRGFCRRRSPCRWICPRAFRRIGWGRTLPLTEHRPEIKSKSTINIKRMAGHLPTQFHWKLWTAA